MFISSNLFNAILAIVGSPERDASFYAVAYQLHNAQGAATEKVISFRGTDNFVDDLSTGFGVGAGSEGNVQGLLAADFYDTVSGGNLFGANGISFVGHSMGGGFAQH